MSQGPIDSDGISVKEESLEWKEECVSISSEEADTEDEYAIIEEISVKGETDDSNSSAECGSSKETERENPYDNEVIFVKEKKNELNGQNHEDLQDANTSPLQHDAGKQSTSEKTSVSHSTVSKHKNNDRVTIMAESCKVVAAHLLNKSLMKTRRFYKHPDDKNRLARGEFNFFSKLCNDEVKFFDHFRMSIETFEGIHTRLEPHLKHCDLFKCVVCPKERLAITISYLTTGVTMSELRKRYKLGIATIKGIIEEVCIKIWENLKAEFLPEPNWQNTAQGFEKNANFPNCIGALGVKRTQIVCLAEELSDKKPQAMIILAMCDTSYRFTYVDVACGSKAYDTCSVNMLNNLKIPPAKVLPGTSKLVPYIIVADDACASSVTIIRPYFLQISDNRKPSAKIIPLNKSGSMSSPKISKTTSSTNKHALFRKKIFNYRLKRALRYVESTLAIMTNRFSIFARSIKMSKSFAELIMKAIFVLHNFVIETEGYADKDTMIQLGLTDYKDSRHLRTGSPLRDHYSNYFVSEGAVPWQNYIYL